MAEACRFGWQFCSLASLRSCSSVSTPSEWQVQRRSLEGRLKLQADHLPGYDQGVFSGIVGNDDFLNVVDHPSAGILGIIVSIYNLGCFSGTIVSFIIGDRLGPRKSMWFAMVWIIVSLLWSLSLDLIANTQKDWCNDSNGRLFAGTDARRSLCHWHWNWC